MWQCPPAFGWEVTMKHQAQDQDSVPLTPAYPVLGGFELLSLGQPTPTHQSVVPGELQVLPRGRDLVPRACRKTIWGFGVRSARDEQ